MKLTRDQVLAIFNSYQLKRYPLTQNRSKFEYKNKVIVRQFHNNTGNGYIWGKDIKKYTNKYEVNDLGLIKYAEMNEVELRELLNAVLALQDKLSK